MFTLLTEKPIIKVIGNTIIWKTRTEVDECSIFYEDIAKLSSEVDNSDVLLSNKYKGTYHLFYMHYLLICE